MGPSMIVSESSRSRTPKVCSLRWSCIAQQVLTSSVIVWRTSTPEPTDDGIIWTYTKDVTRYIPLFSKPGTFILELDNLLTPNLTGQYDSTCAAISPQTIRMLIYLQQHFTRLSTRRLCNTPLRDNPI